MLELTKNTELIWCIDEIKICAPDSIVKITSIICKNKNRPIIVTTLKKVDNLFL